MAETGQPARLRSPKTAPALILASLALFGLGLPDGMLGVAWPSMSRDAGVPLSALGILVPVFTAGYITAALMSGRLSERLSLGSTLAAGAALLAAGLVLFAVSDVWAVILSAAWVAGMGGGAIDSGLNSFAAEHLSVRAANWIHAFYGVGAAAGPVVMTGFLVRDITWRAGYFVATAALVALAMVFAATRQTFAAKAPDRGATGLAPSRSVPRGSAIWISVALFAVCTGLEVSAGQWAYTLFKEGRGAAIATAGAWMSAFFAAFTLSRVALGVFPRAVPTTSLLRTCSIGALLGSLMLWIDPFPYAGLAGMTVFGASMGPVFPSLVATTRERVGWTRTSRAVGLQMAAAGVGGLVLPGAVGAALAAAGFEAIAASIFAGSLLFVALHELGIRYRPLPDGNTGGPEGSSAPGGGRDPGRTSAG